MKTAVSIQLLVWIQRVYSLQVCPLLFSQAPIGCLVVSSTSIDRQRILTSPTTTATEHVLDHVNSLDDCARHCQDVNHSFDLVALYQQEHDHNGNKTCFCTFRFAQSSGAVAQQRGISIVWENTGTHNDFQPFPPKQAAACQYPLYRIHPNCTTPTPTNENADTTASSSSSGRPTPRPEHLCPDPQRFYCQSKHSISARINNFMSYMTIQDKIATLGQDSIQGNYYDGTPLLNQHRSKHVYNWWNEALHGVTAVPCEKGPCTTQFPEANALSCAWDRHLWFTTAIAISTEARASFNTGRLAGLTFYAPQINLASNPLWGRAMETPGEDVFITSEYAEAYIRGLQGNNDFTALKTVATPKHFLGHFFEGEHSDPWGNGTTVTRFFNDSRFTLQDLEHYYMQPFRRALRDAKAKSLMCAYSSVNGVPMCANGFLLNRVVRQEWNWTDRFIVLDCDAIKTMIEHGYSPNKTMAVRDGIRAGCDQNCGGIYRNWALLALRQGRIKRKQVDIAIRLLLKPLFEMRLFDGTLDMDPYAFLGNSHIGSRAHSKLVLEGARQSIVLLQNGIVGKNVIDNGAFSGAPILPLVEPKKRILVVGPLINAKGMLLGN